MTLQNTLRVQVDKPVWEWARFAPAVSSGVSTSCSADNSTFHPNNGRYIYYLISVTSFWRYDTWTDTYMQLNNPPASPTTWSSMRFAGSQGYRNRVLAASGATFTAGVFSNALISYDVKIIGGTGMGQRRVVTGVADAVVADSGVVTATSSSVITDSTKAWTINQWVGYIVRITYGAGINVFRKIISNTATTITCYDSSQIHYDYEALPLTMLTIGATAGNQSFYSIESSVLTVDTAWDTAPDATSRFMVASGVIYYTTQTSGTPYYSICQYDIASDLWYARQSLTTMLSSAPADARLERIGDNASLWERGRATSGSATTLVDTSKQWATNQWVGYNVRIWSGSGRNTLRAITGNTTNTLTIASGTALNNTSYYFIEGYDTGTASGGSATTVTDSTKAWTTNQWRNFNLVITGGTGMGQSQTVAGNTGTVLTVVKAFATTPDSTSTYSIRGDSDKMWMAFAGFSQLFQHDLESELLTVSRQLDCGVTRFASAQYADYPAIAISSGTVSGGVITITAITAHNFKTGMSIKHLGDSGASATANNITATITVTGANTYTYPAPGSVNNWSIIPTTTTTLIDTTKNWTTNQWVGYLVTFNSTAGVTLQIASNTATTLTFVAATAATAGNGLSRYAIHPRASFGSQESGIATGTQSTTTLQDTSKSWASNQWAGKRLRFTGGSGQSTEVTVTSNTSNTLTFAVSTAPLNGGTTYSLLGVTPRGAGLCLEWGSGISDQALRGRYLFSARGGALVGFDRYDIVNDSWQALNTTPQTESLTTGSMYAYDGGDRLYFTKEVTQRVYYLDLKTNWLHGGSLYPYVAGTAMLSNRMEVYQTADGLKYLWLNRHGNLECFIQLCGY